MYYSYITNPITNKSHNLFSEKGLLTLQNYLKGGADQQQLKNRRRNAHRRLLKSSKKMNSKNAVEKHIVIYLLNVLHQDKVN